MLTSAVRFSQHDMLAFWSRCSILHFERFTEDLTLYRHSYLSNIRCCQAWTVPLLFWLIYIHIDFLQQNMLSVPYFWRNLLSYFYAFSNTIPKSQLGCCQAVFGPNIMNYQWLNFNWEKRKKCLAGLLVLKK